MKNLRKLVLDAHVKECIAQDVVVNVTFDNELPFAAACHFNAMGNLFTVTNVEDAHLVSYNLDVIEKTIKHMCFSDRNIEKIAKHVVTFFVKHEVRHAWQAKFNKEMLVDNANDKTKGLVGKGYGEAIPEKDANEYACLNATGDYKIVAEYLKMNQDFAGRTNCNLVEAIKILKLSASIIPLNVRK